jgi:hypothetical protein
MKAFSGSNRTGARSTIFAALLALMPFSVSGAAKAQSIDARSQSDILAQTGAQADERPLPPPPSSPRTGQTADTAAGRVGERQRADQADGIEPMARINNRIANRVQSRVRNRIDRNYDPMANASSPFAIAGQATGRTTRRNR